VGVQRVEAGQLSGEVHGQTRWRVRFAEASADAEAIADAEAGSDAEAIADAEAGSGAEAGSDAEASADAEAGSGAEARGPETGCEDEVGSKTSCVGSRRSVPR